MRIIRVVFLVFFVLLSISSVKAEEGPPIPIPPDPDPDEEQVPINENIALLLTAGLVLGATVVYKNNKKASI